MGYDWSRSGDLTLREGVTLEELVNAFHRQACSDAAFDPQRSQPFGDGISYELTDDVLLAFDGASLHYNADSNSGWLDGVFGAWLEEVAEKFAAEGWTDYDNEGQPNFMGPTEAACHAEALRHHLAAVEHATSALRVHLAKPPQPSARGLNVWIVRGIHPTTPGEPTTVHASEAGAIDKAAELVRLILADSPLPDPPAVVTPENWEEVRDRLEDFHGAAHASVWVLPSEVQP